MGTSIGTSGGRFAVVSNGCRYAHEWRVPRLLNRRVGNALTHRVVAVVLFVAVVASAGCGGAGTADQDALIAGFDAAVAAVQVTHVDGPTETTSKDLTYITGSGLTEGDVETALKRAISGLLAEGMEVENPAPLEEGAVVVARDDTIAVQVGVYLRVGVNEAPEGMSIVQISVAPVNAGLAWARE